MAITIHADHWILLVVKRCKVASWDILQAMVAELEMIWHPILELAHEVDMIIAAIVAAETLILAADEVAVAEFCSVAFDKFERLRRAECKAT